MGWTIGVRSPRGAKDFSSSPCVHAGSGANPACYPMGTGGPFPEGKARPGRDADTHPYPVPRLTMSRSYTSSPPCASMACSGTAFFYGHTTHSQIYYMLYWITLYSPPGVHTSLPVRWLRFDKPFTRPTFCFFPLRWMYEVHLCYSGFL
jgi:hypothetical protein